MIAPKLTRKDIIKIHKEAEESFKKWRQEEEDKRCKRGKFAPERGICRVCEGVVEGKVEFHHSNLIGGPPPSSYISHWECKDCGLMYGKAP